MITSWEASHDVYLGAVQPHHRLDLCREHSFRYGNRFRGNIDYDQIRVAARTGNGPQLLTWSVPGPGAASSTGTPGQIAYDSLGNFYFCYATNSWAQIGAGGYSTSF